MVGCVQIGGDREMQQNRTSVMDRREPASGRSRPVSMEPEFESVTFSPVVSNWSVNSPPPVTTMPAGQGAYAEDVRPEATATVSST